LEIGKRVLEKGSLRNKSLERKRVENGTLRNAPDFGLCRGLWTRRRIATSQQRDGAPACHMPQEDHRNSAWKYDSRWWPWV